MVAAEDPRREDDVEPSFFQDPRRLIQTGLVVAVLVAAIYVLLPSLAGFDDAIGKLDEGTWYWYVVAIGFTVLTFASYVALFRGVIGRQVHLKVSESYQITMAGLAATRLLSAGGAKPYGELLAPFGLDARDPGFWQIGLSMIEGMIAELEAMEA